MNRLAILAAALVVALITLGNIALGRNLVMPLAEATEKGVGAGPWFLVWGMIALTAASAVALIAFLVRSLGSPARR